MSDTPRTDAAMTLILDWGHDLLPSHKPLVDCSRQLERDLAERAIDMLDLMARAERAEAERDALKADAERLRWKYRQYLASCSAAGIGGGLSWEQWIAAIDAARKP